MKFFISRTCLLGVFLTTVATATLVAAPASPPTQKREGFHLSDLLPRSLQRNPRLQISVLTEMTPEGKALPAPDTNHPVYYAGWDGGLVEGGDSVAGEKPPERKHLAAVMQQALAASGYLPATKEHPPTIVLHYRWGSYNRLTTVVPPEPAAGQPGDAAPNLEGMFTETNSADEAIADDTVRKNLMTRAALVGGPKFAFELLRAADRGLMDDFRMRDSRNEDLVEMALGDLYFVVAVAYDANAARRGKARALWTTKISTNSNGLAMDDTLPALALNGRKFFGHETEGPVLATPRLFAGNVEIGEPVVVKEGERRTPEAPAKTAPDRK